MGASAAAHPAAWSLGSDDSEKVKIASGNEASGFDTSPEIPFVSNEDVKSNGAVSPATRATASTTPVRMPPIAVGKTML